MTFLFAYFLVATLLWMLGNVAIACSRKLRLSQIAMTVACGFGFGAFVWFALGPLFGFVLGPLLGTLYACFIRPNEVGGFSKD